MEGREKRLARPYNVFILDDQQPLSNPKPYWLMIASFNELVCAEMYVRQRMLESAYIKGMKIKKPDGSEILKQRSEKK